MAADTAFEIFDDVSNPLDSLEEMLSSKDWNYSRLADDELTLNVAGERGTYTMSFLWQEEYNVMQSMCECDMHIPKQRQDMTSKILRRINENMWLGHFDVPKKTGAPCLRHTSLLRGCTYSSGVEHIQDLVEIAVAFCERYYNVFDMLANSLYITDELIDLAMAETGGRA